MIDGIIREGAANLRDLEWKSGGRGHRVGEHLDVTLPGQVDDLLLDVWSDAGLVAIGQTGSHLHALRAQMNGFLHTAGTPEGTGEPERQSQARDLPKVRLIPFPINRFTLVVELHGSTGRGVVAAGRFPLDDKTIDLAAGFAGQGHGESG